MDPAKRAAQQSLIGLFRGGYGVRPSVDDGLHILRGKSTEEGTSGTALTPHLDALSIPYRVAISPPCSRSCRRSRST